MHTDLDVDRGWLWASLDIIVPAVCADGTRITIETSGASVVTDRSGEVVGVFNMIRDVTDRDG